MDTLNQFRANLERDRDHLRSRHLATEAAMRESADKEPDILDRATSREDDAVIEALDAGDVDHLNLIEAALNRMDLGTFGVCLGCGTHIPAARLQIVPFAARCATCAEAFDRR
jgi:RNA polymerase-binding protein DksA